jgi:4-aminobutyrate aminotransferase-like enzyme
MIGVELVEDRVSSAWWTSHRTINPKFEIQFKKTRKAIAPEKMSKIWESTKDMGVLIGKGGLYGNVFRVQPPMCITTEDVDFSIDVLRRSFKSV